MNEMVENCRNHLPDNAWDAWRISDTVEYIIQRHYTRVAAQFPDELLENAIEVVQTLKYACKRRGQQDVEVR